MPSIDTPELRRKVWRRWHWQTPLVGCAQMWETIHEAAVTLRRNRSFIRIHVAPTDLVLQEQEASTIGYSDEDETMMEVLD